MILNRMIAITLIACWPMLSNGAIASTAQPNSYMIGCTLRADSDGNPFPTEIGKIQHGPVTTADDYVTIDLGKYKMLVDIGTGGNGNEMFEILTVGILPLPSKRRPIPAYIYQNEGKVLGDVNVGGGIEIGGNFKKPIKFQGASYAGFSYDCRMVRVN